MDKIKKKTILYLHGIGSGAASRTPRSLGQYLPDYKIIAPELPERPEMAVKFIKENMNLKEIDLVIGTSLGGFYALTLPGVKKLIINPALFADRDIPAALGMGYQRFLCERMNGATEYIIDEEFIEELEHIRKDIFNQGKYILENHNLISETYALFGENDPVVSHYDDFCRIFDSDNAFVFSGGHRLTEDDIENELVPLVKQILSDKA